MDGLISCGLLSPFYSLAVQLANDHEGVQMAFAFEKLNVYQKAVAFADAVCTLARGFPCGYCFLVDQWAGRSDLFRKLDHCRARLAFAARPGGGFIQHPRRRRRDVLSQSKGEAKSSRPSEKGQSLTGLFTRAGERRRTSKSLLPATPSISSGLGGVMIHGVARGVFRWKIPT